MTVTAYFDFDGTLIAGDSDVLFHLHMTQLGRVTPRLAAVMEEMMSRYVAGRLSPDFFREFQRVRLDGWTPADYEAQAVACFHKRVRPTLFPEAYGWIAAHRARGHRIVLLSAGTHPLIAEAGRVLACDAAYGVEPVVADAAFTGAVCEPMPYAEGKIAVAEADAARAGGRLRDCFFYSDNGADLPLLSAVGQARVVHPNTQLADVAAARGWPIYRPEMAAAVTARSTDRDRPSA